MYRRYLVLSCVLWSEHIMPAAYHHNIIHISKLNQIGLTTFKCSLLVCTVYLLTNCSFRSRKGLTMYLHTFENNSGHMLKKNPGNTMSLFIVISICCVQE